MWLVIYLYWKKYFILFLFYFVFLFYFILFYFILFYFILFYFILFYFILFYFILRMHACLSPKLPLKCDHRSPSSWTPLLYVVSIILYTHSEFAFKPPFISVTHFKYGLERRGMKGMVQNGDLVIAGVSKRGGVRRVSTVL